MSGRKSKDEKWLVAVVALVVVLCATCMQRCCVEGEPVVPCMYKFGDSLTDNGNNNNLIFTRAKANYSPYGIDAPRGPTGRFTNNRTESDFISQFLELADMIPSFANRSSSDDTKGLNYASGAAGILYETGKINLGENFFLGAQISNHLLFTVPEISRRLGGNQQAKQYLMKCLYYFTIGSTDYLLNYFLPEFYPSSKIYNTTEFADLLIDQLTKYTKKLIESGARKIVLSGLGPIGSTPYELAVHGNNTEEENRAAAIFDQKLKSLVDQFNNNTIPSQGARFVFTNTTAIYAQNPELVTGFPIRNISCCPINTSSGSPTCIRDGTPCPNRSQYLFWDGFHPTDPVYQLRALSAYNGSNPSYTHPMTISQLARS